MTRKKKRGLNEEDRELWDKVARTTRPLHKKAKKTPEPLADQPEDTKPIRKSKTREPVDLSGLSEMGAAAPQKPSKVRIAPDPMTASRKPGADIDRRSFDRLRKGKIEPEVRLDLHGMTAEAAHRRLLSFVRSEYAKGTRLLLVITGKGNTQREEPGIMPVRRGLLRHSLPAWLSTPEIRPMILQITEAHARHGGGGAYYVYLRRRRQ